MIKIGYSIYTGLADYPLEKNLEYLKLGKKYGLDYILSQDGVPKCKKCGGIVRPDVVLYGEMLDIAVIEKAINYISQADCLIIVGTSLTVQPAASMVKYFRGRKLVLINKESTPYDRYANLVINDSIENVIS